MPYTVEELITKAYNLSGIVSKDFEQPSGSQTSTGLSCLNDLLGDKSVDSGMIPYYKRLNFAAIAGTSEYFIDKLIDIETFTFFVNSIRYSTLKNNRANFFGAPRAENIQSLPFNWHVEREFNETTFQEGARLFLYFVPDTTYPLEIWGLFGLEEITNLQEDLALTYPRFYIQYLRYQLAVRLCDEFSYTVPGNVSDRLEEIEKKIDQKSGEMDLAQQTISTLSTRASGLNYGQVNIGHGWIIR